MGSTGALIGSAVLSTLGDTVSGKSSQHSANAYLNNAWANRIPKDISGLRYGLSSIFNPFSSQMQGGPSPHGPFGLGSRRSHFSFDPSTAGFNLPGLSGGTADAVRSQVRETLTPSLRESMLIGRSPEDVISQIDQARRPAFEAGLASTLDDITARFGPMGHRAGASSDLAETGTRYATQASQGYEASLQSLWPQITDAIQRGSALFPQVLSGLQEAQYGIPLQLLGLGSQFASTFPPLPGYPSAAGTSGMGTGLASGGQNAMNALLLHRLLK